MSAIIIPSKLKVGFKLEKIYGTEITNLISFITFFDEKTKKWNSETNWNKWIDSTIPVLEFDNIPRSGFILNHNVGGVNSGYSRWTTRTEKMRIFCSDFDNSQFEITLENLTFLMKNTSHVPEVGFESECIFGFDSKKIFLIPTVSEDYQEILKFTKISKEKIKSVNELVEGGVYITNKNEKVIFIEYAPFYKANEIESTKNVIFVKTESNYNSIQIFDLKNLKTFNSKISEKELKDLQIELSLFKGFIPYRETYRIEYNRILTLQDLEKTLKYSRDYEVFIKEKNSFKSYVITKHQEYKDDKDNFTILVRNGKQHKQYKSNLVEYFTLYEVKSKENNEIKTYENLEDFLNFYEFYSKDYIDQRTEFYELYILDETKNKVYHIDSSTNKKEIADLSYGRIIQNLYIKEKEIYKRVYINYYEDVTIEIKNNVEFRNIKTNYILTETFDNYGFDKKNSSIGKISFDTKEEIFKHFELYHQRLELLD